MKKHEELSLHEKEEREKQQQIEKAIRNRYIFQDFHALIFYLKKYENLETNLLRELVPEIFTTLIVSIICIISFLSYSENTNDLEKAIGLLSSITLILLGFHVTIRMNSHSKFIEREKKSLYSQLKSQLHLDHSTLAVYTDDELISFATEAIHKIEKEADTHLEEKQKNNRSSENKYPQLKLEEDEYIYDEEENEDPSNSDTFTRKNH